MHNKTELPPLKGLVDQHLGQGFRESVESMSSAFAQVAIQKIRKKIGKRKQSGYREEAAWAFLGIAMILKGQRKYSDAYHNLEKAGAIFSQGANEIGLGIVYNELSCINREIDRNALALDYVFKALQIFESGQHKMEMASAYDNLSIIHLNQFNRSESLSYAKKARAIFISEKNTLSLAWNACNLGNLYQEMGQYQEAKSLYQEAEKNFADLKIKQGLAWAILCLGTVARLQTEFKESEQYLRKAWKIFESLNLTDRAGWAVLNIAGIKWAQGKLIEAEALNKKALQFFTRLRNNDGLAWGTFQNARILRDKGRLTQAWQLVRQSLNLYNHIASQKGTGWAECELGEIYYLLADLSHARECFIKAKGLADRLEIIPLKSEVEKCQANVFLSLGYVRSADLAIESSLQLSEKYKAFDITADALIFKSRLALVKKELANAEKNINQAREIIEKLGVNRLLPILRLCLAELFMLKGKPEEASQVFIEVVQSSEFHDNRISWIEANMGLLQAYRAMKNSKLILSRLQELEKYIRNSTSRKLKAKFMVLESIVKHEISGFFDMRLPRQALQIVEEAGLVLLKKQFLELFIDLCQKNNRTDEAMIFQKELITFLSRSDSDIKLIPDRQNLCEIMPVSIVS
ncbi:MAG: hypothetical protein KCHDKBKB_00912 [Elusimicrobia bacterium]|nr:hypothetical protein [Elusimicrobiota bacterium]